MKPVRVAVVGAGHLGRIHARIISTLEEFTLVGVADPVVAAAQRAAAEYGGAAFADYRQLVSQVEAVVVATPTTTHHDVALDFLDAGAHVLIEKPMTTSLATADAVVAAARRAARVVQVGHVERFNPAWAAAQAHIRDAKFVEAVRTSGYTFRSTDIGVVLDLMIHDLDLVLSLVRSPVSQVEALGVSVFGQHEDIANARVAFENGCVATLSASRASHTAARRMQVWTQRGFAGIDFSARTVTLVEPSDALVRREIDFAGLSADERAALKDRVMAEHLPIRTLETQPADAITAELRDFAASIRGARAPRVSCEQARETIAVAEAILSKIGTHAWNGSADGPVGPQLAPAAKTLRGPHWAAAPARQPAHRREAG